MATYQSYQSNTATASNSLTITKPTSLAVGDLMLAQITAHRNNSGTSSLNTPSGWTLLRNVIDGSGYNPMSVFYKVADSADVAASDFTFTSTGGSSPYILGHLLRFTSFGLFAGDAGTSSNPVATTQTTSGFTPTRANCTFVFFANNSAVTGVGTLDSYAIATDNPTWTERSEIGVNTGNYDTQLAFATASRSQTTTTGTITLTKSTSDSGISCGIILVALAPVVNGSVTPTTYMNAYSLTGIQSAPLHIAATEPTTEVTRFSSWSNTDKPTTTWVNTDK